ncbi:MAG: deoxyribose-phosphate aldolase [Candidatus Cloacimonadales bacterium]
MDRIEKLSQEFLGEDFRIDPERVAQWPVEIENLAQYIDHTILKADATDEAIIKICQEAEEHQFRSVCVNPVNAALAQSNLPTVDLCCVVGFPLGQSSSQIKAAEAKEAIAAGAAEIDMVINLGWLKSQKYQAVEADIKAVAAECHAAAAILKVIIETCLLTEEEKIIACLLSLKAGADFVKTSTGFSSGGATVEDIALMRAVVGDKIGVKASGGIRDRQKAVEMLQAGANRIGASSGIKIIKK